MTLGAGWAAAMAIGWLSLGAAPAVELISHRGESADAPENTLAAFNLAWKRKVPAIELDVHVSKDQRLVCIHDGDLKRTTGVAGPVKEAVMADLQKLDAGAWKHADFAGERLPTLEEALATIPEGGRCFIELKTGAEAVPPLVAAVEASGKKPEQLAVISFNAAALAETKRRLPKLKAYFLSSFKQDKETGRWSPTAEELIAKAQSLQADGLDLEARGPLDAAFVAKIRAAKLGFYVWTVDDPKLARRMVELGVDGITTNKAAWLAERLTEPTSSDGPPKK